MTNETKQTAVEWLYNELTKVWYDNKSSREILEQAKEMEKQQISQAYEEGTHDEYVYQVFHAENLRKDGEQYYKENYTK